MLGAVPDGQIAELAGVSPASVGRYRRKHGIPAYQGHRFGEREQPKKRGRRRSVLEPYRALVGVLGDEDLAAIVGISPEGVRIYRRRHGIPRSREGAVVPQLGQMCFEAIVRCGDEDRHLELRAPDMISACVLARRQVQHACADGELQMVREVADPVDLTTP